MMEPRNDGGMLYRCGRGHLSTWAVHRTRETWQQHHGHRPIGTLADYLGVGTGVLVRVEDWTGPGPVVAALRWERPPRLAISALERTDPICWPRDAVPALLRATRAAARINELVGTETEEGQAAAWEELDSALAPFDFGGAA